MKRTTNASLDELRTTEKTCIDRGSWFVVRGSSSEAFVVRFKILHIKITTFGFM